VAAKTRLLPTGVHEDAIRKPHDPPYQVAQTPLRTSVGRKRSSSSVAASTDIFTLDQPILLMALDKADGGVSVLPYPTLFAVAALPGHACLSSVG
jgi:hypothetical protein